MNITGKRMENSGSLVIKTLSRCFARKDLILRHGKEGEIYNDGGHNEMKNIDIVKLICRELGKPEELITYVEDRKGHDRRYAIDPSKIHRELGWLPETSFAEGIKKTINWYLNHQEWWRPIVEKEMKIKC